jgi:hypothetical protein
MKKLLGSTHLSSPTIWLGGPGHRKGTSPPSYPAQPTFLRLRLGWASLGIGRAQVLQATRLSPPFFAYNLVGRAWVSEGHESSKVPGSAHLFALQSWKGRPRYRKGMEPSKIPGLAHHYAPATSTTCRA